MNSVFPVLIVLGLLALAAWKLRRGRIAAPGWLRRAGAGRALESVDRLPITPEHAVHLIRVRGRELMIATYPRGCVVLNDGAARGESGQAA